VRQQITTQLSFPTGAKNEKRKPEVMTTFRGTQEGYGINNCS